MKIYQKGGSSGSCDIKIDENIIYSLEKVLRNNKRIHYIFVGTVSEHVYSLLKKLENLQNIKGEDAKLLRETFPKNLNTWVKLANKKDIYKIKFIQNRIEIDDSINEIRKKIFVFLSDTENGDYLLPENQELWVEHIDKHPEIIGYYYENIRTKEKIDINPIVFKQSNKINLSNNEIKINTSENSMIIYDLMNILNIKNNTIYFADAKEWAKEWAKESTKEWAKESTKESTKGSISDIKIHWPYANLSYNTKDIKNIMLMTKESINKESYIFSLIKSLPKDPEIYGLCINTINIDTQLDKSNEGSQNIDLFQVFDYIREKKINRKTPYLKYYENLLTAPFSLISKEALDENIITKDQLKKWIGVSSEENRKMTGISVKRFFKNDSDKSLYSTILFDKSGKVSVSAGFSNSINAGFCDIQIVIDNCKKFVEDINNIKKIDKKIKITSPNMNFKNGIVTFADNTKLIYVNISIPLKLEKPLDFKKLTEFSLNFPSFLAEYPKDILDKDEIKSESSLKLKFKRISGFANMNEILRDIDILKQSDEKDSRILKVLENKYKKSIDELKKYLLEWKKKYSTSKSLKIDPAFRDGIKISITNTNIKINGITKIYQIPIVYNFFCMFLTVFLKYDEFLKDKNFKKYFSLKYLEEYNSHYEIDKNAKLDLDEYDADYEFDEELFINQNINKINASLIDKELDETVHDIEHQKYIGIAEDEDIDPNIRLTCDDPLPELDTCKDYCNDPSYFLRRLQRYDINLFKYRRDKKNKKQKSYSRVCQNVQQQPIVLPYDPSTNPKIDRESYTYSIKYSSDPQRFYRWYICPKIWCPYCEIPISESAIDPKTIKKRSTLLKAGGVGTCKTALCPFGDHQVIIKADMAEKGYTFPGFKDPAIHPKELCTPCCFILDQSNPKSSFYKSFKKCLGEDVGYENIKNGQIYILGKGIPIEKDRYGKLNLEVANILNTKLETGYLGTQSGYARKGIEQINNNSFLSAISDIFMCDYNGANNDMNIEKLTKILIEKLNTDIFKSLHAGNLVNIFKTEENYKSYLTNSKINIDHKYLWDYLQRDNILYDNGINIFIFENNTLLCPMGENINYFFDKTKKSIILIKYKEYYEPIYYLEGLGKTAKKTCIYQSNRPEINKLFDILYNGCQGKFDIEWLDVLKSNMKKYDIKIDNLSLSLGDDLQYVLNEILINIKNKRLNSSYIPSLQYVDSYNKVFGLKLNNNLYLPINPSKLNTNLKYKIILDINDIERLPLNETLKLNLELIKKTKINNTITHKILDLKEKKYIIALVNENNRFIPIRKSTDIKILKVSTLNYYSDLDRSLNDKIEMIDKRIEQINKKNFEDETYMRMRFELSKFLQLKENKHYLDEILDIINKEKTEIVAYRDTLYKILEKIFKNLISVESSDRDFYNYKTPNKRIPCYNRDIHKKNKKDNNQDYILSCEDDPHCVKKNNTCKLFVSKKNLLYIHKNLENYNYYLSMMVEELLRFVIKRNEILKDDIPVIINKELIEENPNKYIIIHTLNYNEINQIIDKIFLDTKGLHIDTRSLYEDTTTKYYSFNKSEYIKSDITHIEDYKLDDLSIYWSKLLGDSYKIKTDENTTIFSLLTQAFNIDEFKNFKNKKLLASEIKYKITNYLKNKNSKISEDEIINLYKECNPKYFKQTTTFQILLNEIQNDAYMGCEVDLEFIAKIYKINIVILDRRIKKNQPGYKLITYKSINTQNKNTYFLLIYKSLIFDTEVYNLVQYKNKTVFKIGELPLKFIKFIL